MTTATAMMTTMMTTYKDDVNVKHKTKNKTQNTKTQNQKTKKNKKKYFLNENNINVSTCVVIIEYLSFTMSRFDEKDTTPPDCQDWTTVTFNKRPSTTSATKPSTTYSLANVGLYKAASDDDTKKTKYVGKATSDAVKTARCEKKLTQKELAQKCNMDAAIVNEIERGGGVYNAAHINKIQTVLGVKIPR